MKNIFTYFNKMLPAAVLAAAVFFRSAAPGAAQQLGQVLGASGIWRTGGDILQELSWHDDSAYSYWYPCGGQLCAGARSGGRAWLQSSVTGPLRVRFRWNIDPAAATGLISLGFYIDGVLQGNASSNGVGYGDSAFYGQDTYYVPPGPHTLMWVFNRHRLAAESGGAYLASVELIDGRENSARYAFQGETSFPYVSGETGPAWPVYSENTQTLTYKVLEEPESSFSSGMRGGRHGYRLPGRTDERGDRPSWRRGHSYRGFNGLPGRTDERGDRPGWRGDRPDTPEEWMEKKEKWRQRMEKRREAFER